MGFIVVMAKTSAKRSQAARMEVLDNECEQTALGRHRRAVVLYLAVPEKR